MSSLALFDTPPRRGQITVCEWNGHLVNAASTQDFDLSRYCEKTHVYPSITVSRGDLHQPTYAKKNITSAFLPGKDNIWRKALAAWNAHGITGALEELIGEPKGTWLNRLAHSVLATLRWIHTIHGSIHPHLQLCNSEMIEEFSSAMEWEEGLVRAFAWHPHVAKFAVVLRDDSVKIYKTDGGIAPILKHRLQKGTCDVSWRPFTASTLAVACQSGVIVWNMDPTSVSTRPSSSSVQWLTHPGHSPVTSVQWSPCGKFLLSCSPRDSAMMIWDVTMQECVPLRRTAGGGVAFARWSLDGKRILAATPSKIFRVWETQTWTWEWWSTGSGGRLSDACWSPDGTVLLVAIRNEAIVYSITFSSDGGHGDKMGDVGGSKAVIPVVNLASVLFEVGEERVSIGGTIQSMVWDPLGKRLAVTFSCVDGRQELIAIFSTILHPTLELRPCGFIRGRPGEVPQLVSFRQGLKDGALLSVCWSSGEIAHIPFIFTSSLSATATSTYQFSSPPPAIFYSTTLS